MDLKTFTSVINQLAEEKGIAKEKLLEIIEMALAAAYKKDYGQKGQIIKARFNPETGEVKFSQIKLVADKDRLYSEEELEKLKEKRISGQQPEETKTEKKIRFNPERHIMIEEAKKTKKEIKDGEEIEFPLTASEDYGRIAAQTAKQVIIQKLHEAERETILNEFKQKEGEIISGIVQRIDPFTPEKKGRNVYVDIGKTTGILFPLEQIPGEYYKIGQRFRFYVLQVEDTPREPQVVLSRAHPKFLTKLFELEVPEISGEQVVIKSIAREPGSRSKVALSATEEGIDPIGSAVGQKGTRIMVIINELGGEKIDVIEWSEDPEKFIANSISPAKVRKVKLSKNQALVIVPEDQLSLAIGKNGQNVRLAAKLTGWKIDVRGETEYQTSTVPKEVEKVKKVKEKKGGKVKKEKTKKKTSKNDK